MIRTDKIQPGKFCFNDLQQALMIRCLYLLHRLTGRHLQLVFISKPDAILFSGSSFHLRWKVSGCHQVTLNDTIVLPGNSSSVALDAAYLKRGPLIVCFYGCNQTIKRSYVLEPVSLPVKKLSQISLQDPELQAKKIRSYWPSLQAKKINIRQRFSPRFGLAFSLKAERCPATINRSDFQVQLPACELPEL